MIKPDDLYAVEQVITLAQDGVTYGTLNVRYEVRQVTDVRNLTQGRAYRVLCTQRVRLPNPAPCVVTPQTVPPVYENYAAMLNCQMQLNGPANNAVQLIEYVPKTLNTAVCSAADESDNKASSLSRTHTSGSSTAQTNSYGGSVTLGFLTASATADYNHSATDERSSSDAQGRDTSKGSQEGSSDSMSIKDWASYAQLDAIGLSPSWVWAQEYPWDIIMFHMCDGVYDVFLPVSTRARLFGQTALGVPIPYPPSHLSLFGVDFTMKATWHVSLDSPDGETLNVAHNLAYQTATHGVDSNGMEIVQLAANPIKFSYASAQLDLTLLGMDPISHSGADNGAVVGFVPNKFILPPAPGGNFKILSGANNLQVSGSGFDDVMTTSFAEAVVVKVQFKVTDDLYQYSLFIKHWKTTDAACILSAVFNGDDKNPLLYHVNTKEGEGGSNNLLEIDLRNKDYASIDYHDYLVFGLNTIEITITPEATGQQAGYKLRAIAIGQN